MDVGAAARASVAASHAPHPTGTGGTTRWPPRARQRAGRVGPYARGTRDRLRAAQRRNDLACTACPPRRPRGGVWAAGRHPHDPHAHDSAALWDGGGGGGGGTGMNAYERAIARRLILLIGIPIGATGSAMASSSRCVWSSANSTERTEAATAEVDRRVQSESHMKSGSANQRPARRGNLLIFTTDISLTCNPYHCTLSPGNMGTGTVAARAASWH